MVERIWDPSGKFAGGDLSSSQYWSVEVSTRQHTLGCFAVFLRQPKERVSDLSNDEAQNLPVVLRRVETALMSHTLFRPDRFNYLQIGNALHHLHPRYARPRIFAGREWTDASYGMPPIWTFKDLNEALSAEIRQAILQHLP